MPSHARQSNTAKRLTAALALIASLILAGFIGHTINRPQVTIHLPGPVVTVPAPHHHPTTTKNPTTKKPSVSHRTYTVRKGDTLWGIAAHIYHNPLKWHSLWEHNLKVIGGNPDLIHTGTVLQLE